MSDLKAPKETTFMDFFNAAQERPEQFQTGLTTLGHINEGAGGAQRAAVGAAQSADNLAQVLEAAKGGFLQPQGAPSWSDIAKKAGVENKYGLAAAGLVGPLIETDLIPGPNVGAAKKELKAFGEVADNLQTLNKEGKMLVKSGLPNSPGMALQQAAKAESELKAVQNMKSNVLNLQDVKVKTEAKKFVQESLEAELKAQPAVARDPEYLKERIKSLFNFYVAQKGG